MNKDNTFRALQDQAPFVERWQCRVGLHRWLKWSAIEKTASNLYAYQHRFEKKASNLYAYQHRYCADCNHGQSRRLKTDW